MTTIAITAPRILAYSDSAVRGASLGVLTD